MKEPFVTLNVNPSVNTTFISSCFMTPTESMLNMIKFTHKIKWIIFTNNTYVKQLPEETDRIKYVIESNLDITNINLIKKALNLNLHDTKYFCWISLDYLQLEKRPQLCSILPMFPDYNLIEMYASNNKLCILKNEGIYDFNFIFGNNIAFSKLSLNINLLKYIQSNPSDINEIIPFVKKYNLFDEIQTDSSIYMFNYLLSNYFKRMHTPNLFAGLGNRIFQVLCVYSMSLKTNGLFVINKNHYTPSPHSSSNYIDNIFSKFISTEQNYNYKEPKKVESTFSKSIGKSKYNLYTGYFQHIDFVKYADTDLLTLPHTPIRDSYFIHFRFGDYSDNYKQLNDYYSKAVRYILSKDPDAKFWVCSDDNNMAKDYIANNVPELKDIYTIEDSISELETLSKIKNNIKGGICTHSTFSWCGSYMNKNPNKIVILPSKWFNYDTKNCLAYPKVILIDIQKPLQK